MKVLVLGAGVMGITCAYYLARDGHEVTVIDRQPGPALETSFSNAGGICPSMAGPWAAPGMPFKVMKWLFQPDAPLALRPTADPAQWRWLASFLTNCAEPRFLRNKAAMQRIAHHSRACLNDLVAETGIAYDEGQGGVLQIFRTQEECDGGARSARVLHRLDNPHRLLTPAEARATEPALARSAVTIAGGLHLPLDQTGDCRQFTERLQQRLAAQGVSFAFSTSIDSLVVEGGTCTGIRTPRGVVRADAVVVALATASPVLLQPHGIRLPVYPVKGYALTAPIRDLDAAPRSSIMDEHSKVMVTRLGARLRAAGIAEVAGYSLALEPHRCNAVRDAARTLFPDAVDYDKVSFWTGLRPMTPDGPPYLGETPVKGLFLNTGQGSNGWTQACGSGHVLADVIAGRKPAIDLAGLTLERRSQAA